MSETQAKQQECLDLVIDGLYKIMDGVGRYADLVGLEMPKDSAQPPAQEQPQPAEAQPAPQPQHTREQLAEILTQLMHADKREVVKQILTSFGAENLSGLALEHYDAAFEQATKALGDGQ